MSVKEPKVPKGVRLSQKHWAAITEISDARGEPKSAILRECLGLGIAYYKARESSVFISGEVRSE